MAPSETHLLPRYYCNSWTGRCYNNTWNHWGRWVLAGVAIFLFCLVVSMLLCARQRRRRGIKPMYGTGWMAPAGKFGQNQNQNTYAMHGQQNQHQQGGFGQQQGYYGSHPAPPPAYGNYQQQPQYTGNTFQTTDGYYGQGQTSGVQPPQGTYNPQDPYGPPPGPPPAK